MFEENRGKSPFAQKYSQKHLVSKLSHEERTVLRFSGWNSFGSRTLGLFLVLVLLIRGKSPGH